MPRGPRLDYPGAVQHVIARGIERRRIFRSDRDRLDFLDRFGELIVQSGTSLYAWVLMPNHVHAILRTARLPLSRFMQRLLGGYASAFNRRYNRCGHLFQNRFKNTLVEEETYLLELVRYLHLNPVRSQLPTTLDSLDDYRWTGHAVLLGNHKLAAQDTDFVLGQFGNRVGKARRAYRNFVHDGMLRGIRVDLEGGGLRRSAGGWEYVANLGRGREGWSFDERILGGPRFVEEALSRFRGPGHPQPTTADRSIAFLPLVERVARDCGVTRAEIAGRSLRREILRARSITCTLGVRYCGLTGAQVARHLGVSEPTVGRAIRRADDTGLRLDELAKRFTG